MGLWLVFGLDVVRLKLVDGILRWVPAVVAVCSVVSLYAFTQIDSIVNQTLYQHGLQFDYAWATPYWNIAGVAVAMGWLIVGLSVALQAYNLLRKAPEKGSAAEQPEVKEEERWSTFRLGDGSTIKVKLIVKGAKRLNKYSADGMPVYTVETEPIVQVIDVPEALRIASK
jgi:hypothetical protein